MRKALLLCSIFIFCLSSVFKAQTPKSFEIKPGLNLSKYILDYGDKEYSQNNTYYPGIYVGVNADFINHKWISILAEAGFTMKSYSQGGRTNPSYDYVYLSPMFKARKEFGQFIPYVFVGPRIDFLLTPKSEGSKKTLNKYIYGILYGFCMEYTFSDYGISLGFHHQYNFNNAMDDIPEIEGHRSFKQNTFTIFLGLKAYFQKKPKSK